MEARGANRRAAADQEWLPAGEPAPRNEPEIEHPVNASEFEAIVRQETGRLLSVARRILRNEEEARDAVQQGFIQALKALHRFKGGSKLSTWLHRIVVNEALMKIRQRRRLKEDSIEPLLPAFQEDGHHAGAVEAWPETAESEFSRNETRAMVRRAIDQLPETYRTILLLRDIEEIDTAEAARSLGISDNAVKVRLHRARQALRGLLAPEFTAES